MISTNPFYVYVLYSIRFIFLLYLTFYSILDSIHKKSASLTVSFIKVASWLAKSDLEPWKRKKSAEKNKRDLIVNGRCLFLKIFWSSLSGENISPETNL